MTKNGKRQPVAIPLEQRREPIQARAQASVNRILVAAAELLEEVGIDDFNTNLLAQRTGVLIRTVYRYFPNKFSIIATLGEEMFTRWEEWLAPRIEELSRPDRDLAEVLRITLEGWLTLVANETGGRAIMQAVGAVPHLRELDRALFTRVVARYKAAIADRFSASDQQAEIVSNLIVSAIYGVVDCYFRIPVGVRTLMPGEISLMIADHLQARFSNGQPQGLSEGDVTLDIPHPLM